MPKKNKSKLKIVERKLGRENALGLCYFDKPLIEIDERLEGKERFFCLTHELIHRAFGENMSEETVLRAEKIIGEGLWQDGYRRVDNKIK